MIEARVPRRLFAAGWLFLIMLFAAWLYFVSDAYIRQVVTTTVLLSLEVTAITLPIGATVALLFSRTDLPGGRVWPMLCTSLLILPSFVLISGWDAVIGPIGWAKAWLPMDTAIDSVRWWSAVLLHSLLALPGVILLVALGLSRTEAELEEIALMQRPWPSVLLRVALRRASPLLVACALWIFITVSGEIAVTDIYQIRTMAEEIYLSTGASATASGEFPYQGLFPFLLLTSASAYLAILLGEGAFRADAFVTHQQARRFPLAAWKWPLGSLTSSFILLLLCIPLASLIYKAGVHVEFNMEGRPFQIWSGSHTWGTLQRAPELFADELYWTAIHALLAGALTLVIALTLSWAERWRPALQFLNTFLVVILIATPGPLVAIGLLQLLSRTGSSGIFLRDRTLFAPVVASSIRILPWIILLIRHAFRTLPNEQLALAKLQGWNAVKTLFYIALPQRWAIVVASFVFSAALCLSDVATTLLVSPPGVELASVRMMGMLHSGVDNQLAGLALLLVGIYCLCLFPLGFLLRIASSRR